MATIMDYLDWRGDLRFESDPFNEVDGYLLSKVGCPDYSGIVPADWAAVGIGKAVSEYFSKHGENEKQFGVLASQTIVPMLLKLPETERFRDILLSGFVNRINEITSEQFSALTLVLPDGTFYVTFRGTDDTLLGWKENMLMSVSKTIPAQEDALDYLIRAASSCKGSLIVGGHSKGGNLAVYASAKAPLEVQDRIRKVYNFDGPGFSADFFRTPGYELIRDRIRTLLPQYSIVGMLLPREENIRIVNSTRAGVAAHDGFLWEVKGPRFVRCSEFSRSTQAFENSMRNLLAEMDTEQRTEFIDELFDTLSATGAKTITDVTELHISNALKLGKKIYQQPQVHHFVFTLLELMLKDYASDYGMER